jgi:simple sugar transport system ATP-binding protein
MSGIAKRFGETVALRDVDFAAGRGEIHGLLGENGAGKTTLMNILSGLYRADRGEIALDDRHVSIASPVDALRHGIGMVHQHVELIPNFTALENILLGREGSRWRLMVHRQRAAVDDVARCFGLALELDVEVSRLAAGVQQKVEILKALYRGVDILILDEPTTMLTPQEVDTLFATVRAMTGRGLTVIFITHKIREILANCDRVTVMRGGGRVATLERAELDEAGLVELMIGESAPPVRPPQPPAELRSAPDSPGYDLASGTVVRPPQPPAESTSAPAAPACDGASATVVGPPQPPPESTSAPAAPGCDGASATVVRPPQPPAESRSAPAPPGRDERRGAWGALSRPPILLDVRDLNVPAARGHLGLQACSVRVAPGEVVGVAGVAGNGQRELADALVGLRVPAHGAIMLDGRDVTKVGVRERLQAGLVYIAEDRIQDGLLPGLSVAENFMLGLHAFGLAGRVAFNRARARALTREAIDEYAIRAPSEEARAIDLSGGNIQKVLVARAMTQARLAGGRILVALNPTRGLDVRATEFVRRRCIDFARAGGGVLLVSEDLDELRQLCDRIAVMFRGAIVADRARGHFDPYAIGRLMAGMDSSSP